jgi:hypothetical protein
VAARGGEIGVGGLCGPPAVADEQQVHHLLCALGLELSHSRHHDALLRVVPQVQIP